MRSRESRRARQRLVAGLAASPPQSGISGVTFSLDSQAPGAAGPLPESAWEKLGEAGGSVQGCPQSRRGLWMEELSSAPQVRQTVPCMQRRSAGSPHEQRRGPWWSLVATESWTRD